ncbi:MAG: hypothetical protein ACYSUT_04880 [Planctomycetota bacterium]|jgi:hypothetical protein
MQVRYYTKNGSVYTKTIEHGREFWTAEDKDGNLRPLIGGVHIALARLRELVHEYPSTLLDQTLCFDVGVEAEFFEDAKREQFTGLIDGEETVVFFLAHRDHDHYGIGSSSIIERIEIDEV